jgi:hypothetical protein
VFVGGFPQTVTITDDRVVCRILSPHRTFCFRNSNSHPGRLRASTGWGAALSFFCSPFLVSVVTDTTSIARPALSKIGEPDIPPSGGSIHRLMPPIPETLLVCCTRVRLTHADRFKTKVESVFSKLKVRDCTGGCNCALWKATSYQDPTDGFAI